MAVPKRVVVVGGGIIGCASAYELAKAGCAVTVIERTTIGAEASSAAAGMLAPLGESAGRFHELALASWRLYPEIIAELRTATGVDVEYTTTGSLHVLFTPEDVRAAEAWCNGAAAKAAGVTLLDGTEVFEREPAISRKACAAVFVPVDHWVNNQRLTIAYAKAAGGRGVTFRLGARVQDMIVEGGRVCGVVAEGERVVANAVLLAAGAWSGELLLPPGARLPVGPARGQMLALAHVPPVIKHCIHGADVYLVPRSSGELLVGATVEHAGFVRAVTAEGIGALIRAALELVPDLAGLPITRTWCGFRPWAPDNLPILGPWPGVPGLAVATAHFRSGILLAPITSRLMTELIADGEPSIDLTPFLPDRFIRKEP